MNIKDYREKELKYFIIANILAIVYISGVFSIDSIVSNDGYLTLMCAIIENGIFSGVMYSMSIIFDSVISHKFKQYIVFQWRGEPGGTIFTELNKKNKDHRFTVDEVKKLYPKLYAEMPSNKKERREYENNKWYSIYRKHENETKIQVLQRDYLLCRDMSVSLLVILTIYLVMIALTDIIQLQSKVVMYILILFVICVIAANVKAKRFVSTVIASDVHKNE